MVPNLITIGEKYTSFISNQHNFFQKKRTKDGTVLKDSNISRDPFDYHLAK